MFIQLSPEMRVREEHTRRTSKEPWKEERRKGGKKKLKTKRSGSKEPLWEKRSKGEKQKLT
jgi:hypothetical protein